MFADMFNLKPAPVVGARLVQLLETDAESENLTAAKEQLDRFLRLYDAQVAARAHARRDHSLERFEAAQREFKRIEHHVIRLRKQIEKMEAEREKLS